MLKINNLKAKKNTEIDCVTFVKAFKNNMAQSPVEGFVAVVKTESINMSGSFAGGYADSNIKGEMYTAKVVLDIFSGSEISGESLSDITLKIMNAIEKADESSMISNMEVSPIEFDENLKGIFRKLIFQLDFCLCGEIDDWKNFT